MSKIFRNFVENCTAWYTISIEDNEVFMNLDSLEYMCRKCEKHQYIDLSPVPPGQIPVICRACDTKICSIQENDFKVKMIPIDEVYDHLDPMLCKMD